MTEREQFEVEPQRREFLSSLSNRGIDDARVLQAMEKVRREVFLPPDLIPHAYHDGPLPIGSDQTISQPSLVAMMTQALDCDETCRVLELGTGSGYQTAILAELSHQVYTVERIPSLAKEAAERLGRLGYQNIHYRIGDGYEGWGDRSPFHRIIVTAAAPRIPTALLDQLAPGGRLVIPVGEDEQELFLVRKNESGFEIKRLGAVAFVPLVPGPVEKLAG